jgi:hypothetical protein
MLVQTLEYEYKFTDTCNHYKQALTILNAQKTSHMNLQQFYAKYSAIIKCKLKELCKNEG